MSVLWICFSCVRRALLSLCRPYGLRCSCFTRPRALCHTYLSQVIELGGCTLPTRCVAHCLSQLVARSSRNCIVCYLSQVVSLGVGDCIETTLFFAANIMVIYCIGIARNVLGCIIIQVPVLITKWDQARIAAKCLG